MHKCIYLTPYLLCVPGCHHSPPLSVNGRAHTCAQDDVLGPCHRSGGEIVTPCARIFRREKSLVRSSVASSYFLCSVHSECALTSILIFLSCLRGGCSFCSCAFVRMFVSLRAHGAHADFQYACVACGNRAPPRKCLRVCARFWKCAATAPTHKGCPIRYKRGRKEWGRSHLNDRDACLTFFIAFQMIPFFFCMNFLRGLLLSSVVCKLLFVRDLQLPFSSHS